MKLNNSIVIDEKEWREKGYQIPQYDRKEMIQSTIEAPFWIHFGAGNIFRAFQANIVQKLLNEGSLKRGLLVAEGYDYDIIEKMYKPHDNYSILATLKADGTIEKTVVGSIAKSYILDAEREDFTELKKIFSTDSLQMVSFTITEKGYSLTNARGEILPDIKRDLQKGTECPKSYMGKVAALLYERFQSGAKPIAMVSMDNCSHNGDKLKSAIWTFAENWVKNGIVSQEFEDYVKNDEKVSYPWTMIDKITPRPNEAVKELLEKDSIEDLDPIVTSKNTYVAPFVNAEECEYLVIENVFPNGRPELEKSGVIFTDRATVDKVEKMKVCTCLNPLHTALAVYGCLLGYDRISDEMKDIQLKRMVEQIGYDEGLPVVIDPGILNPKKFIDTVLNVRIPNPFMPDTPQRIATDTSQKLAIRFGETIKAYKKSETLQMRDLKLIPLVFAGWFRYLTGIDDEGKTFGLSPDPLLEELKPVSNGLIKIYNENCGSVDSKVVEAVIHSVMKNKKIFGVDLYDTGLAERVCGYLAELLEGKGSVRRVLKKYVPSEK